MIGFSFPVVPQGKARIRTQMSAAHTTDAQSTARVAAFAKVGRELGVIGGDDEGAGQESKREPGIWMEDVAGAEVGPNDVLIKIAKTAICGTDVHIYNWDDWAQKTIPVPMVVGHEFVGEIVEIGSEVRGFKVGDRVSGEGHITCGHCRNCRAGRRHLCRNTLGVGVNRPGASPNTSRSRAFNAFQLPDDDPDEIAAIFDPLGNAVHTALSFDLVGEDVLITGAGPIGIMAAAIAQARRRAPRRDHRRQRLPARARARRWARRARSTSRRENARRRHGASSA